MTTAPIRSLAGALALLCGLPAAAEPASPWVKDGAAALRLVDAGAAPGGGRLAAVAIRLEPGWKTYWRQPGDSGVPPRFDFSGSRNVAGVSVAYPAPERQTDDSGVTNVYHGEVALPVTVHAKDPAAPVTLVLVADYGACAQVCVPVHAETSLELSPDGGFLGPAAAAVHRSVAAIPKPTALGGRHGALGLTAVRRRSKTEIEVEAAAPGGPAVLFAETGEGDYVAAPEPLGPAAGGSPRFRIGFPGDLPASGLRLTLVAGGAAIETAVPLDAIAPAP